MSLHLSGCSLSGPNSPNLTVKQDYYIVFVGKIRHSGSRHGKSLLFLWSLVVLDLRLETHTQTLFILVKQATCFIRLSSTFAPPEKFLVFFKASNCSLAKASVRWCLPVNSLSTGSLIKRWRMRLM